MSQSSLILGALLAGFVLFIAARNRLPLYAAVLWGPAPSAGAGASASASSGSGILDQIPSFPFPGAPSIGDLGDILGDIF